MDINSAKRTLSEASLATRKPALAYGIQRLFDRDVPIFPGSKWCAPYDPLARGMLNVRPTNQLEDVVNGVLIEVDLNDLLAILAREEGYDLIPIVVEDLESAIQAGQVSHIS